jgi:predicted translin family RNA/ssDNA-binding protein
MNVFGSSEVGEMRKVINNLEIANMKMKNDIDKAKENIKSLEEIISATYTKIEVTTELKNKIDVIENTVNYTEKYLSEVVDLLHTRDSDYFKISSEVTTKEEGRV